MSQELFSQDGAISIRSYRRLKTSGGRSDLGLFLVEGPRAVRQISQTHPSAVREVLIGEDAPRIDCRAIPVRRISSRKVDTLCTTKHSQHVVAVVALPADAYGASIPRNPGSHILLLEDVQDPGNVGALIRCAAAFDYSGVLLTEKCADPFSAKAVLASAGTLMTLWIRRGDQWRSILDRLIDSDFRLLVADASGEPVAPAQAPFILAAGNEGAGVSPYLRARAHAIVSIPINTRRAESLNVSVAGALCMYGLAGPRG